MKNFILLFGILIMWQGFEATNNHRSYQIELRRQDPEFYKLKDRLDKARLERIKKAELRSN